MASRYLAADAVDLNTTASWKATIDGATGQTVPTAADDVHIKEGTQTVNTNPTTLNVDLESVTVSRGFTGNLGEAGTPLTIACSNSADSVFRLNSGGLESYITAGTAGIDRLVISVPDRSRVYLTGGTFVLVEHYGGELIIAGSATVTNYRGYGNSRATARAGTQFTTALLSDNAWLKTERTIATGNIAGSAYVQMIEAAASGTLMRVMGGTLNLQTSGTIAQIDQYGGLTTPAGARDDVPVTLFNLYSGVVYEMAGQSKLTIGTKGDVGGPSFTSWTTGPGGSKSA